jgi:SAM-dependent methyltransferase
MPLTASAHWAQELAGWAIDPRILAAAPEPPWGFPPELFRADRRADAVGGVGATVERVSEIVADGGSVLDVGCGGGGATVPALTAGVVAVGVDESADMLQEYATAAAARGALVHTVLGTYPDVASQIPLCDVVVAANVVYNVPVIDRFLQALATQAIRRVVIELTERHPLTMLAPLWQHFHGQARPAGPTYEDFVAVLQELGIGHQIELGQREPTIRTADPEAYAAWTRRRLCLEAERQPEVDRLLAEMGPPALINVATIWWDRPVA